MPIFADESIMIIISRNGVQYIYLRVFLNTRYFFESLKSSTTLLVSIDRRNFTTKRYKSDTTISRITRSKGTCNLHVGELFL